MTRESRDNDAAWRGNPARPRLPSIPRGDLLSLGRARDYLVALLAVVVSVAVAHAVEPVLGIANLSLVFLTGVLLVAVRTAPVPALVTALMSALAYNYFFTEPRYTLQMHRTDELLTVVLFLVVGIICGHVAGRLRQQMQALRANHEHTQMLAELNRRLAAAADPDTMANDAVNLIAQRLRTPAVILCPSGSGLERVAESEPGLRLEKDAWTAARLAMDLRHPSGFLTDPILGTRWRFMPLIAEADSLGVIGVRLHSGGRPQTLAALDVVAGHIALAMARVRLAVNLRRAELAEETERLRSALLSSVSHDLKTPLASMLGAASTLRDLGDDLSAADRRELADAIASEGSRLNRYIENLLDMTRLGQGALKIERDWIGLDDLLNAALQRTSDLCKDVRQVRAIPRDLPLLYVHPALVEQALVNVIENAARFSPAGGEITIAAGLESDGIHIRISDQGPGIPPEDRPRVFEKFFTRGHGDRDAQSTGLGLTICAGMIAAHMGRVEALAGPNGHGTTIHICLPITPVPEDLEVSDS